MKSVVSSQPHSGSGNPSAASGWLIYYHFRCNKTDWLIFWTGLSFFFHFCFIVEGLFLFEFYFRFCGFGTKRNENPFYSLPPEFLFVDHLPIATTSQAGK